MERKGNVVATGTWHYDGLVPMRIAVVAYPARFATSRYDEDDQLDESVPVPITPDGLVYKCEPSGGEGLTLEEAKTVADAKPWGPVTWDPDTQVGASAEPRRPRSPGT